jgi:hypothetical protein
MSLVSNISGELVNQAKRSNDRTTTTKEDERQKMNTRSFKDISCATALALGLMLTAGTVMAADQMKGAQRLMQIKTLAEADALKPGDTMVMVCAKCKSVMIHNVSTEKGHIKTMTVGEKHMCPGCESTITVVSTGKGGHDEVKHTCEKCGDDSVFCCATKPGQGGIEGIEKK